MIKVILYLVIGYFALKVLKKLFGSGQQTRMETDAGHADEIDDLMVKDPHCQTYVPKRDAVSVRHRGETLYFCSDECRDAYLAKQ